MTSLAIFIFSLSVFLIVHTYVLYPLFMLLVFKHQRLNFDTYKSDDELPHVAILIAAHNEEKVIFQKIRSVFETNYPLHKLEVLVGSDASTDETETIINALKEVFPALSLKRFTNRVGKIGIINELQANCAQDILILTDANVMFTKDTIHHLVAQFKDDRVGLVAANIIKLSEKNEGIAKQEKAYLSLENKIKAAESNGFACIMGAEGGCYAVRNVLFKKVPGNFIVDDFFITMQVVLQGKKALFNSAAICFEDVAGDSQGEYRRKVRISSGNFQNLVFFKEVLYKFWQPTSIMFWSHKVLRWLTPFFMCFALISAAYLSNGSLFFGILFVLQLLGLALPLVNHYRPFKSSALRFMSHFYLMNIALLAGFFRFSSGIHSSVWQPVKRDV